MSQTMDKLAKMSEAEYTPFIRVLFGLSSPSPVPEDLSKDPEVGNIEWFDKTLNDSQKDAIRFALASKEIALIHGPPGVSPQPHSLSLYIYIYIYSPFSSSISLRGITSPFTAIKGPPPP